MRAGEGGWSFAGRVARDGTPVIAAGSLIAGIAAYVFQVLGGRALGEEGFAPVAALLSVHSLILAVLLAPVELLTVRRLTLARGGVPDAHDKRAIGATILVSVGVMTMFVTVTLERFFASASIFIVIGAVVVITHAIFALARGGLAGQGRYTAYGLVSAGAAVVRVVVAVVWLAVTQSATILAWAVALPPLIILLWRPFRRHPGGSRVPPRAGSGVLMAGFVLAGAISQAFVLVGPLVAGALTEDPAAVAAVVSIMFVTFSLARAPLLLAQNLAARLLAGLTKLVARNAHRELRSWSRRLGVAGLLAAPLAYAGGASLGPEVIAALFGPTFRPSPQVAGLAIAACVVAATSVFLDQILVAIGATGKLAAAWAVALVVAGLALWVVSADSDLRVAVAVSVGEVAALLGVMVAAELAQPESPDAGFDLVKRAMDFVGGLVLLLVTLPFQVGLAIAVRLSSPGPVLFRQTRVGKNEQPFTMVKLRSMADHTEEEPPYQYLSRVAAPGSVRPSPDPEGPHLWAGQGVDVTRLGEFLRRTSLDELPNLWNVITGRMSLVGPRPLVAEEVELLAPEARARHKIRPGLTGLAQVEGGLSLTFAQRAYWDLVYVDRRSLLLDLSILLKTPLAAFRRRPRRSVVGRP